MGNVDEIKDKGLKSLLILSLSIHYSGSKFNFVITGAQIEVVAIGLQYILQP